MQSPPSLHQNAFVNGMTDIENVICKFCWRRTARFPLWSQIAVGTVNWKIRSSTWGEKSRFLVDYYKFRQTCELHCITLTHSAPKHCIHNIVVCSLGVFAFISILCVTFNSAANWNAFVARNKPLRETISFSLYIVYSNSNTTLGSSSLLQLLIFVLKRSRPSPMKNV